MKLFVIGLLSGIISGMGIGGGSILIPSLVLFANLVQQQAQSINLIVFIPVAIAALIVHIKEKNIIFKFTKWIVLGGIAGAILGSIVAIRINPDTLRKFFSFFLFFIGLYELKKKDR
jgi:uncharacterized membrane protein YfcA